MKAIRYVEGRIVRLERLPGAIHLRVHLDDRCILSGLLKRVFPLSVPDRFIAIQDASGEEVAVLKDLAGLDSASRQILDEEVDRRYYTPHIEQIDRLKQEAGMWHFSVLTQRGQTDFYVRNWRDNAQEISPNRWQIMSVDGARYEIPDLEKLDARSKRFLDQLL